MTTYSVGDSIAAGIGKSGAVDKSFSRPNIPVGAEMHGYFEQVAAEARPGETVIVSGGYNGGDVSQMVDWIKPLTERGVKVRILGLREEGLTGEDAPYPHLDGKTPPINNKLREVARESGAVFAEDSIRVANTIPGHEIHGNFVQLAETALDADDTSLARRSPQGVPSPRAQQPRVEQVSYTTTPHPQTAQPHDYIAKESLSPMSRTQVTEIQELLHKIDLQTKDNRYDLGQYGTKGADGKYDGVDHILGTRTSHSIQDYESRHGLGNVSAEKLIADLQKTVQLHSEPAELPSSAPQTLIAQNDTGQPSKVRT